MTGKDDECATMIADCEARESKLTDWERGFIDSLSRQTATRAATATQLETLETIWDRVTS